MGDARKRSGLLRTTIVKTTHRLILTEEYIAEAQRLSIAQNKMLKLMYQTWWVQWLARVIMVGFIIYLILNHMDSAAVLFGVFLAISFWGEWFGRRSLAKARERLRAKGSTTVVSMNEQGVDIDGALGNSHLKWPAMLQPAIYPQGVLIRFSRLSALWLPDQSLIEGSSADVRQLLADNIDKSDTNGP
jgi:hypothetical protein